jgi:hypothetical protein
MGLGDMLQAQQDAEDAVRYRYLRDRAGNAIMRKLMDESRPSEWDKIVDRDREHADKPRGASTVGAKHAD